ncbi:hypothetical protein SAY86_028472 [Trapa natans]|uniref:Mitochondrial carrier protein n=1 Tax=Trapa natans TaxID=22666 RepID=A0AAN7MIA9_TRANT|nr:hypothetical protein SAY86_028472 [Trapa natans]
MSAEAAVGVANSATHGEVVDMGHRRFLKHHRKQQPVATSQQQLQLGTVQHLLAGGVAGAFSKTCTAPLSRLTILFQVQGMHTDVSALKNASIWHEASRIFNEEGLRAFWKGNLVMISHRLPYSAISFYTYEQYKRFLYALLGDDQQGVSRSSYLVHFAGGGLAGLTAASATYPLDLVRTRLAAQRKQVYYRGLFHAFHTIYKEECIFGLYKGLGPTLLVSYHLTSSQIYGVIWVLTCTMFFFLTSMQGVGPTIAINFSVFESLRSFWLSHRPNDSTVMVSLACGSLSGIISSTVVFPIDLVRRRMQLEGAGGQARVYNTGLFGTFRHIIQAEGFRGLYRGILPEYCKVVPGVGILFMTNEALKRLLSRVSAES